MKNSLEPKPQLLGFLQCSQENPEVPGFKDLKPSLPRLCRIVYEAPRQTTEYALLRCPFCREEVAVQWYGKYNTKVMRDDPGYHLFHRTSGPDSWLIEELETAFWQHAVYGHPLPEYEFQQGEHPAYQLPEPVLRWLLNPEGKTKEMRSAHREDLMRFELEVRRVFSSSWDARSASYAELRSLAEGIGARLTRGEITSIAEKERNSLPTGFLNWARYRFGWLKLNG